MDAGNVIFKFKGDSSDLDKQTSSLGGKFGNVALGIGKAFAKGAVVAGTALTALVGKSVTMAGELEQNIGGSEAVFQEFASTVQETAGKAFDQMGMSQSNYLATANKMAAIMQGNGYAIEDSMNLSAQVMQRASDVASVMGITVDDAMTAVIGASKNNFTMMDNLGVAMNETTLEAYALSKGIKKSYGSMTNAEKSGLAFEMFLEKTAYAEGNYAKENETFAGSLTTLKGAFANFMSGEGSIEDVTKSLTRFGKVLVNSITTLAPEIITGIVQLVNAIIPQLPTLIQQLLPPLITGIVTLTQGLISAVPQIIQVLTGMLPQLLQGAITIVLAVITGLAENLPTMIPMIVDAILGIIPILIDNLPLFMKAGWQLITGLLQGIIQSVPSLLSYIPKIIASLFKYFAQLPKQSLEVGINLIKGLWNGISNVTQWLYNKISGFVSGVLKKIKGFFGIHSPSKEFEYIGVMNVKGMEKGFDDERAELQDSFNSMFDLSPNLYGTSMTNMSPYVNVNVYNETKQDPLGQMVSDIKTFSGGSKQDYNYGSGV